MVCFFTGFFFFLLDGCRNYGSARDAVGYTVPFRYVHVNRGVRDE